MRDRAIVFASPKIFFLRCGSMKVSFTTSDSPFTILLSRCIIVLLTELEKTPTLEEYLFYINRVLCYFLNLHVGKIASHPNLRTNRNLKWAGL